MALAFLPINDRPMEVWLRNLWKRLNSPTQYFFHKNNPPIAVFQDLYFLADPHQVLTHVESQKKLTAYLNQTRQIVKQNNRKSQINQVATKPIPVQKSALVTSATVPVATAPQNQATNHPAPAVQPLSQPGSVRQPFFIGVVKNNRKIPLPGIMVYIKDAVNNQPLRLMKTNPHGIFATYNPLPQGNYGFEIKDPKGTYFFDTMKVTIGDSNPKSLEFFSKEML